MITFHGLPTCRCLSILNDHVYHANVFVTLMLLYYISINYTCCAKMAGKEETPKCRKKTVTWTNEMIEDLIDFIEIPPNVAFEAIYEPMLTSFWSLISFAVQLYIIMQYKGQHPPLLPKIPFVYCISRQNLCVFIKISCIVHTQT